VVLKTKQDRIEKAEKKLSDYEKTVKEAKIEVKKKEERLKTITKEKE
jgi:hypothetical protein